jgi:hypothetical protein
MIYVFLGIRPPARKVGLGSNSKDPMDQITTTTAISSGNVNASVSIEVRHKATERAL